MLSTTTEVICVLRTAKLPPIRSRDMMVTKVSDENNAPVAVVTTQDSTVITFLKFSSRSLHALKFKTWLTERSVASVRHVTTYVTSTPTWSSTVKEFASTKVGVWWGVLSATSTNTEHRQSTKPDSTQGRTAKKAANVPGSTSDAMKLKMSCIDTCPAISWTSSCVTR